MAIYCSWRKHSSSLVLKQKHFYSSPNTVIRVKLDQCPKCQFISSLNKGTHTEIARDARCLMSTDYSWLLSTFLAAWPSGCGSYVYDVNRVVELLSHHFNPCMETIPSVSQRELWISRYILKLKLSLLQPVVLGQTQRRQMATNKTSMKVLELVICLAEDYSHNWFDCIVKRDWYFLDLTFWSIPQILCAFAMDVFQKEWRGWRKSQKLMLQ